MGRAKLCSITLGPWLLLCMGPGLAGGYKRAGIDGLRFTLLHPTLLDTSTSAGCLMIAVLGV